jgi:hypothetical protein
LHFKLDTQVPSATVMPRFPSERAQRLAWAKRLQFEQFRFGPLELFRVQAIPGFIVVLETGSAKIGRDGWARKSYRAR